MLKKTIAVLLTLVMLLSLAAFTGAGAEAEDAPADATTTESGAAADAAESVDGTTEAEKTPAADENAEEASETAAEEITYNLGSREITVAAEDFDEYGNFTIPLEEDAFFPYEVQFKVNGDPIIEWFDTPESTVNIAGHTFSVISETTGADKLTQIGFTIGGEYVAARPAPKEFKSESGGRRGMLRSLMPLPEVNVEIDLSSYLRAELKMAKVSVVVSAVNSVEPTPSPEIDDEDAVVWAKKSYSNGSEDDFKIVTRDDYIDLTPYYDYYDETYLELIVGDAKQLSAENTRYIVTIKVASSEDIFDFDLYTQEGATRSQVTPIRVQTTTFSTGELPGYYITVPSTYQYGSEFYLGLALKAAYSPNYTAKVYKGQFETPDLAAAAEGAEVTDSVWNQIMANQNAGLKDNYGDYSNLREFTVVFYKETEPVGIESFALYVAIGYDGVEGYYGLSNSSDAVDYSYNYSTSSGITTWTYTLYKDYPANGEYYLSLMYYKDGQVSQNEVMKAVVGHYDSADSAQAQTDIKNSLFPNEYWNNGVGYKANYSGNGVNFTVFAGTSVYKLTIKAVTGSVSKPVSVPVQRPGSSDVYFNINGANQITQGETPPSTTLNVYIVKPSDDSYFINGYQTALVLSDTANLASIAPVFTPGNNADIHVGAKQTSGVSVQDFSEGPVQYTAKAEDGRSLKNYWVTFVKKETNAKLFVNGPYGAASEAKNKDTNTREIFLTPEYDNHHDIFIANIGGAELTGLSVELSDDAKNVKLDEYWTIGGENNNSLAAFTETYHSGTPNGEIANVAKIRLVPDGEGTVSGKLTISSENGGSYVVYLEGVAGNPKIVTTQEELDNEKAVKFVPYSFLITTNSKYDWNQVTFSRTSGSLPKGVTFKQNGEIYGVPTETGTFKFTVQARYSYSGFTTSSATFTLTVLDNTAANVASASDYEITRKIGTLTAATEQVFTNTGSYGDFMDFYLDGEKLTKDTDYAVEEGSTVITIKGQTFEKAGKGEHTIAAEYREDHDESKTLTRAAQNYTLNLGGSNNNNNNDNDNNNNNNNNNSGGGGVYNPPGSGVPDPIYTPAPITDGPSNTQTPQIPQIPGTAVITAGVESSGGAAFANVDDARILDAISNAAPGSAVEIIADVPSDTQDLSLTLSSEAVNKLAESDVGELIITSSFVALRIDAAAIDAAAGVAVASGGNDVIIRVVTGAELNDAQRRAVGSDTVYDISLKAGSVYASDLGGGAVKVDLPYALKSGQRAEGIYVYYVAESGDTERMPTTYLSEKQIVSFVTTHLSVYAIGFDETVPTPATGDASYAFAWLILAGVSAAGVCGLIFGLPRRKKQQ
jgi:hypothetical protein